MEWPGRFVRPYILIQENLKLKNDFKLYNKKNASGSVMDNMLMDLNETETKNFAQFLSIAKAFCSESRSQFYRVLARNYISKEEFDTIVNN